MAIQVRGIMTNSHRGQVFKKCFNFVQQTVIPGGVKPPETQEHLSGVAGPPPPGGGDRGGMSERSRLWPKDLSGGLRRCEH